MIHNLTEQLPDTYNGFALYVPDLTRYDKSQGKILSGPARSFCNSVISKHGYSVDDCLIRLAHDRRDRPVGTNRILLFGEDSLRIRAGREGIDAHAGFVESVQGIDYTFTYAPQDCVDLFNQENEEEDDEDNAGNNAKDTAPTSRSNFPFWFQADVNKLLSGKWKEHKPVSLISANMVGTEQAIKLLRLHKDNFLFLDIETHPKTNTLQCFSFAWLDGPIYTVCNYDYKGNQGVDNPRVICALVRAMFDNTTVVHNSMFDLLFMAAYHGVPYSKRIWDTMLVHHRMYIEAEKSLAHCIRFYLNERYHKSEAGTFHPRNHWQQDKLLLYNAKDVATLRAIFNSQRDLVRLQPRLARTVTQCNTLVYPYCNLSLQGILVDTVKSQKIEKENARLLGIYTRIICILIGYDINPGSNDQLVDYFFGKMKYKVERTTKTGAPSLESDILYSLYIKYENPMITVLLQYRKIKKQSGMLKFKYFALKRSRE